MPNDDILMRIREIRDDVLEIACASLTAGDVAKFSKLNEIAVTLTELAPVDGEIAQASELARPAAEPIAPPAPNITADQSQLTPESDYNVVSVFAKYNDKRYEAELDISRITSTGSGKCIWFREQWMTPSGSAGSITSGAVNGWRFWRYERPDGTNGQIDELREERDARHGNQDDSDDDYVPW